MRFFAFALELIPKKVKDTRFLSAPERVFSCRILRSGPVRAR